MIYLGDIKIPDLQRAAAERVYSAFVEDAASASAEAKSNDDYLDYLRVFGASMAAQFQREGVSMESIVAIVVGKMSSGGGMDRDIKDAISNTN